MEHQWTRVATGHNHNDPAPGLFIHASHNRFWLAETALTAHMRSCDDTETEPSVLPKSITYRQESPHSVQLDSDEACCHRMSRTHSTSSHAIQSPNDTRLIILCVCVWSSRCPSGAGPSTNTWDRLPGPLLKSLVWHFQIDRCGWSLAFDLLSLSLSLAFWKSEKEGARVRRRAWPRYVGHMLCP